MKINIVYHFMIDHYLQISFENGRTTVVHNQVPNLMETIILKNFIEIMQKCNVRTELMKECCFFSIS